MEVPRSIYLDGGGVFGGSEDKEKVEQKLF